MQKTRTPGGVCWGLVVALVVVSGCVEQREELDASERQALEENLSNGVGVGEPREGSWPSVAQGFRVHLEATLACRGLLKKSQVLLARAWVSTAEDLSPIPVLHPRNLDLQFSFLNGLFAGAVYSNAVRRPDHVYEFVRALDGNRASNPCGCVVAAVSAAGFPAFKSRLVAKRLICPDGMSYEPPEVPK